ncbi:MAG: hypothetical protein ABSG46_09480 [Candidatus Binataceae bacterium]|jgi:hypothetical protein
MSWSGPLLADCGGGGGGEEAVCASAIVAVLPKSATVNAAANDERIIGNPPESGCGQTFNHHTIRDRRVVTMNKVLLYGSPRKTAGARLEQ